MKSMEYNMVKDIDFELFYDYYNINEKENNK